MSKRKKHGYVECLKYIHMIQEGVSIHSIDVKYGINADRLHVLWHRYQSEGLSGLQKKKNIKAFLQYQERFSFLMHNLHLTLHSASLKYGACSQRKSVWLQQYRTGGLLALNSTKRRGRPLGMGRPKKNSKPLTEFERLRKEVQEFKTENAPLKKVVHPINEYFSHA